MSYLRQSLESLGSMKPRSEGLSRDINALRNELEEGMSRDRRDQMLLFVIELNDENQRRAAEVYLARYPGFVLDGDGKLDYRVGDRFVTVETRTDAKKGSWMLEGARCEAALGAHIPNIWLPVIILRLRFREDEVLADTGSPLERISKL
ncbi:hypothetical protein L207DRAFT_572593 [Hyaloscypha variabilis F]|uniref:Uncharacterized protein n=1 Tax=Hyaloscypha variabilis (strain UAMH 11265 / GT02V1 / F) TaxID=1149755 RepID=A0A2J6QZY5_HYAVF|nr:hypothetical protein L207DRAFT_572593 [Hyaloscypha variabilis F]